MRTSGYDDVRLIARSDVSRMTHHAPCQTEEDCVIGESSAAAAAGRRRDIAITRHGGPFWRTDGAHPCYYPLAYALLFRREELGRRYDIPHSMGSVNDSERVREV